MYRQVAALRCAVSELLLLTAPRPADRFHWAAISVWDGDAASPEIGPSARRNYAGNESESLQRPLRSATTWPTAGTGRLFGLTFVLGLLTCFKDTKDSAIPTRSKARVVKR